MNNELFVKVHDYASEREKKATDSEEQFYWQGVKDGLRKARAIFIGDIIEDWEEMGDV